MKKQQTLGGMVFMLAVAVGLASSFAGTARADEWRDHERRDHEWHWRHFHHAEYRPHYVVVNQPPVIAAASSGINIVIPLNIH